MKFEQLYSSSSGNLYLATASNGKRLMIECGVTWSKLQKALNYDLSGIEGCLITHEHKDHCKATAEVIKAGIDVYLTGGTMRKMKDVFFDICHMRRVRSIKDCDLIRFDSFQVFVFGTNHDASEPVGFVIREKTGIYEHRAGCRYDRPVDEFLLFATDTSHITQKFNVKFDIIAIECSYEKELLERRLYGNEAELKKEGLTKINESLAKRLLTSHMEKANTMTYLADFCDLSKCRELHLLHLSGDSIDKKQTQKDFENRFFIETKIKGLEGAKECHDTKAE